jgi:predicted dienelactone hydrolase
MWACGAAESPAKQPDADTNPDSASQDAQAEVAVAPKPDLAWPLDKPGPHAVGYRTRTVRYQPAGLATERTLTVALWYPTSAKTGKPAEYFGGLMTDEAAFADAPLAEIPQMPKHPVLAFTHGHNGFAASSPHLARRFASHGWAVVAPDHTGNTIADLGQPRPLALYALRSLDMKVALDALEVQGSDDPLAGKCLIAQVLLAGHSYGGFTVLLSAGAKLDMAAIGQTCKAGKGPGDGVCSDADVALLTATGRDPRIAAALPMATSVGDAAWFGAKGIAVLPVPILAMTGDDDKGHEGAPVWPWLQGAQAPWRGWLDVKGGCHQLFAVGPCPKLHESEGVPLWLTYALAFGRRFVRNDTSPGTAAVLKAGSGVDGQAVLQVAP